jgi:PIN domain nuclease of toxin-antitoxin system
VNLLLDTHVLLWWLAGGTRLREAIRTAISTAEGVWVSAATAWEIGIKTSLGKLEFHGNIEEQLAKNNFRPLPITLAHAVASGKLPRRHGDPFDRMLIAQAQVESLTLVTHDALLSEYGGRILVV